MGGFDDHVAIIGDWVPPSPSPRSFFTALLGDDVGAKPISETAGQSKIGARFLGPADPSELGSVDDKAQACRGDDQVTMFSAFPQQKMSSRGGLLERMAARAGFNAPRLNTENIKSSDLSQKPEVRSPYLTIPPGLSPTTLLDSPVFLSNSLVQPSPTTGKFPFTSVMSNRSAALSIEATDKSKDNFLQDASNSIFAFKPFTGSTPALFLGSASNVPSTSLTQQSFPNIEVSVQLEISRLPQGMEATKVNCQDGSRLHHESDISQSTAEKDTGAINISEQMAFDISGTEEHSPPLDELLDEDAENKGNEDPNIGNAPSEDGYNWRKYGQKQVKGSEYPRSYYKCTYVNCPVKKKVERSHEGHITEIIYKGTHNHCKPPVNRRSAIGSLGGISDMQHSMSEQARPDAESVWTTTQNRTTIGGPDRNQDNREVTSSSLLGPEYYKAPASLQAQNGPRVSSDAVDGCTNFSNDEDEHGTNGSVSLSYDGEGDESESKRRKIEAYANDVSGATRAIREPRVVVQTTSDVDILDDGYRWRKYGQKVVKGNPNPRSYYKCTSAGCMVRKHVERASHDLKSVITTYEGKHNHDVPAARSNTHVNAGLTNSSSSQASAAAAQTQVHRPEPSQILDSIARFERPPPPPLGSFDLPGRQQLGRFALGVNQQPGLANLSMSGFGPNQGKLAAHPYFGEPRLINETELVLPKEEPKTEFVSEHSLNLSSNGSSVYHQIMSRLPLGHQM